MNSFPKSLTMHATRLLDTLALLRGNRTLCDVFLQAQVENVVAEAADEAAREASGVWAHRSVLAACSPYFTAMFTNFSERAEPVVTIEGVKPTALKAVVDYIYSPESLSVTTANAEELLSASSLLCVDGVRDKVCAFMENSLTAENALGIRAFAEQHACTSLSTTAARFINDHIDEVLQADEIVRLSAEELGEFIDSPTLSDEEHVLDAVLRWTQHLPEERHQHLCDLLQHVRLSLVPREVLAERTRTEPLASGDSRVKDLLIEAFAFHCQSAARREESISSSAWYRPRLPPTSSVLLVVGGRSSSGACSDTVCCELSTGLWDSAAAIPSPRIGAGAAVINGRVYIVGGKDGNQSLNSVDVYDVATGSWSAGPSLGTARRLLGVTALGGVLYAAGGWDSASRALSSVETLDPREGVWRSIADMSTGRRDVSVAALGGMLYAVGGNDDHQCLDSVERYDPAADRWEFVERMAEHRRDAGVAVIDDEMYVVGGRFGMTTLSSMEKYTVGSGWQPAPPLPTARFEATVTTNGGRMYVVGGRDDRGVRLDTVAVFEAATSTWSELPSAMPVERDSAVAVVVDWTPLEAA